MPSGPQPFMFFNMWCQDNLKELVCNSWQESGYSSPLWDKFSNLRVMVRGWQSSRYVLTNSRYKKREAKLKYLLNSHPSQSVEELEVFVAKKKIALRWVASFEVY